MGDLDHYDYSVDKDDSVDTIDFGKYKGCTPKEVFQTNAGYLCWAWKSTNKWVGSEQLIKRAHSAMSIPFEEREVAQDVYTIEQDPAEFEQAMIDAFGCFPIKPHHNKG